VIFTTGGIASTAVSVSDALGVGEITGAVVTEHPDRANVKAIPIGTIAIFDRVDLLPRFGTS
jgi:hypothetical protein